MYSIFADSTCIFNDTTPLESLKVINPKLVMEDSAAGSLELTLPPGNAGYDIIERMNTDMIVMCGNEEIWRGRVITESVDFWKRKKLYCEGELAFLNDTIQPPHQYLSTDTTITTFLSDMLSVHNSKVGSNRQFEIGIVTVDDGDQEDDSAAIYRYTNYESTLQCINEKLVSRLGGHLRVRHQNGVRYLDYISEDTFDSTPQVIQFGNNLLDYTKNFDMAELVTVIIPRGNRLETETIEGLDDYLTVEDAQVEGERYGSIYVPSEEAVSNFGWICAVVDWENVSDATTLYNKAVKYLEDIQFDKMSLEIKMLDMKYLNPSISALHLYDKIRCISQPHGMDKTFPITKMEINLNEPDNSTFTLGTDEKITLTQTTNKVNNEILEQINRIPSKSNILEAAKRNAFNILTGSEGGYVRFEKNSNDVITAIIISDQATDEQSLHKWVFNEGGLGHFHRDTYQDEWEATGLNAAMTMDGSITADYITTGHMSCDRLKGGTIDGQKIRATYIGNGDTIDETTIDIKAPSGIRLAFGSGSAWTNGCNVITRNDSEDCHDGFGTKRLNKDDGTFLHWSAVRLWRYSQGKLGWEAVFEEPSDIRLKENIKPVEISKIRELFRKLNFVKFHFKEDPSDRIRYGLIAQDVEKVLDDIGIPKDDIVYNRGDGYLKLEYSRLTRFCMNAIQDLYSIVEKQQEEIDSLRKELTNG